MASRAAAVLFPPHPAIRAAAAAPDTTRAAVRIGLPSFLRRQARFAAPFPRFPPGAAARLYRGEQGPVKPARRSRPVEYSRAGPGGFTLAGGRPRRPTRTLPQRQLGSSGGFRGGKGAPLLAGPAPGR